MTKIDIRVVLAAIVFAAGVVPVAAQEMPRFNVEAYCKEVASFGGSYSAVTDQGCFQMEQSSYNGLKSAWSDLPARLRKYCTEVATFGGQGSYTTLEGCIRLENEAESSNEGRQFDY